MSKGTFSIGTSCALLTAALSILCSSASPAQAQSAASLLSSLKESKAAGTDSVLVSSLRHETFVNVLADKLSERDLRDRAASVAKVVAKEGGADKALVIAFTDGANAIKEVDFTAEQLHALRSDDISVLSSLSIGSGDQAGGLMLAGSATVTTTTVAPTNPSQMEYQGQRSKIASRIEALRQKGVGVTPFVQELSKIDDQYTHADVENAVASLNRLDSVLTEQERLRKEMKNALVTRPQAQTTAYAGGTTRTVAGIAMAASPMTVPGSAVAANIAATNIPSITDFTNMDAYVDQFAGAVLGTYVPKKGPFLMERIQIGRRIYELDQQHVNTTGVVALFHNMEEVVASHDPRRIGELSSDVRYMQTQLGLGQMKGGMKELRGFFK